MLLKSCKTLACLTSTEEKFQLHKLTCIVGLSLMCGSRKYPYPPMEGVCPMTPHPSGNSNLASYISLNFWFFETPPSPPPRNFQSLLWGEYGYFLEPHNVHVGGEMKKVTEDRVIFLPIKNAISSYNAVEPC